MDRALVVHPFVHVSIAGRDDNGQHNDEGNDKLHFCILSAETVPILLPRNEDVNPPTSQTNPKIRSGFTLSGNLQVVKQLGLTPSNGSIAVSDSLCYNFFQFTK
jgi:hypothetical protein